MPIDTSLLPVFLTAVLLLMITPGPDMVFVTANALGGGRKAGLASLMGVATGAYIHIMAAALGFSTILMASDFIFNVVRFAGAAYIAWVGYCFLRSKSSFQKIDAAKVKLLMSIYRQGALTNLLNPKAALFTVSFVPQFVSADIGPIWQQTVILGLLIVAVMILVEIPIVLASGKFAELLATKMSTSAKVRPSCWNEKGSNATPSKPDGCNTAARPHNIQPRCARSSLRSRAQLSDDGQLTMKNTLEAPDWSTIPAPLDDGAARHLLGAKMASALLQATNGSTVDLSVIPGRVVVYAYPRTGKPGVDNPDGWDMIPGARGCTPQTCSFRDNFAELKVLGVDHLFGLSTQDPDYQREVAERLHLPFAILSDEDLKLTHAMNLPIFETSGMTLMKRFTLVIKNGTVEHVFYPVFPPDRSARDVVEWLSRSEAIGRSTTG